MVVPSIEKVSQDCTVYSDPTQKVNVAFIKLNGMTVELIEPHGEDSPVWQSLKKGTKLVHLCYEVDDMDAALAEGAVWRVPPDSDRAG